MAYANINITEGLGSTVNTILKGAAQLVAGTVDQALSSNTGVTELAAVGIVLVVVVFVLGYAAKTTQTAKRVF
jgi:hypothetical protein